MLRPAPMDPDATLPPDALPTEPAPPPSSCGDLWALTVDVAGPAPLRPLPSNFALDASDLDEE